MCVDRTRALMMLGVSAVAVMSSAEAHAQALGTADIIVTARRTEERLQDVPISINVFNQQQLNDRNVTTATDLATYTPSLSANSNFGTQNTTFAIRGFVQEIATPPSVAVYFADVVAPRGAAANLPVGSGANPGDFFDVQNVQVLKGPQGTLFGRNTTGGAVLFVPTKPGYEFGGYVEGSYGNYDMKRVQGVINAPVSETFRVRIGIDRMKRDGYIRNTTGIGPDDFQNIDYTAVRASIVADLTPDLENYMIVSYLHSQDHGALQSLIACDPSTIRLGSFNLVGLGLACPAVARNEGNGFFTAQNNIDDPFTKSEQFRVINTTTLQASDTLTVKNIVSYAQLKQRNNAMLFGTVFDTADLSSIFGVPVPSSLINFAAVQSLPGLVTTEQSTFTEELRLEGISFAGRFNWQVGGYAELSDPLRTGGSQSNVFLNCGDVANYQCNDVTAPYIPGPGGLGQVSYSAGREKFRNFGIYGQGTFAVTDELNATAGLRYTWDRHEAEGVIAANYFDAPNTPVRFCTVPSSTTFDCAVSYTAKSEKPTWLLSLDYKPMPEVMLYAKYARGYRAGGVSLQSPPQTAVFAPEKVDTYEAGFKTSFRGALPGSFNVSVFYNDFSDQQLQLSLQPLPPNRGSATGVFNAGRSRMYGTEVDASISPFTGLQLEASYTYLNTRIKEITLPSLDPSGGFAIAPQTVRVGDPLPLSPKNKLSATATYTMPLDDSLGKLSIGLTYTHVDRQLSNYNDRLNTTVPALAQLSYLQPRDLLNLNLNWRGVAGTPVDLNVFATNITNEKYLAYTSGLSRNVPFETAVLGEPRTYGVRLRYTFGN